jgi:ABC-type methionine transport system ATPase subunit
LRGHWRRDPDLIICDEVTSALDPLVAEGMLKLLNRIQQQLGVAYLFITHDVATVRAIADEVLVMQRAGSSTTARAARSLPRHIRTTPGCCFLANRKWTRTGSTACWRAASRIQTLRWKKSKESP